MTVPLVGPGPTADLAHALPQLASGLLATELGVQDPFVGPSGLQAVFGAVSAGLAALGLQARRTGLRPKGEP